VAERDVEAVVGPDRRDQELVLGCRLRDEEDNRRQRSTADR
jgi:hypothetical protein